jgi:hypothetical protein
VSSFLQHSYKEVCSAGKLFGWQETSPDIADFGEIKLPNRVGY